ncbi:hypothetical protein HO173_010434 [Letharia columbiana]|uniref:Uncharacterized protein n=1 Tax=Letharia columbiana TaxID=112416 RepID=A0A8H6FMJ4_9LECA|nr:uncharacterized protein HO173_010434 [Letharia columbiana]KAF6231291.1 hypothetical protein HO173_010434 [Letharia columbiana]
MKLSVKLSKQTIPNHQQQSQPRNNFQTTAKVPVSWTPENERKLQIVHAVNNKDIDATEIATHFHGAPPRAITPHLGILREDGKALPPPPGAPIVAGTANAALLSLHTRGVERRVWNYGRRSG